MRAISWKVGFPGGCPTSSLYEDAMNSPQSQNDAVGSMVLRYVNADTTKAAAAAILFHKLNLFSVITYKDRNFLRISIAPGPYPEFVDDLDERTSAIGGGRPEGLRRGAAGYVRGRAPDRQGFPKADRL